MSYIARIEHLRKKKEEQTLEKLAMQQDYMNEDDYGSVPPPQDFHFEVEYNDPVHKTFYGAALWAKNFHRLLEVHPLYVDPQDALAGRWMFILQRFRPFENATSNHNMEMAPVFNYDFLKEEQEKYGIIPGIGKMHHFAPDYSIGLALGWGGLRQKVQRCRKLHPEAAWLYDAEEEVLSGIHCWMARTLQEIHRQWEREQDPVLKNNLAEMETCNRNILTKPPASFLEACQWIAWFNMVNRTYNRAGSGCQLDEILRPYYENDCAKGTLDDEKATFILACLFINDTTYYQIGGPAPDGHDLTSRLSYLILEAGHLAKTSVNLTVRVHAELPEKLLRRSVEILLEDRRAFPRFSGTESLVKGFMRNGYSLELARQRIAVGCHWMSLPGREYTLNDLIKINFAKVMEVALDEYMAQVQDAHYVEVLYQRFLRHLQRARDCVARGIDFHLKHQYKNAPELVLNLVSHSPLERGLDASNGGMEYYNLCVDGAALATVADSFAAIEQRVEREKRLSWRELYAALKENFASKRGAYIRAMLQTSERYGRGNSLGDQWAERISRDFTTIVVSAPTPDGYRMLPGLFSWANTINLGKDVGATANGRYAGDPISHGANPLPGFRTDGALTALSTAVARVQCGYGNTAPMQLELSPTIADDEKSVPLVEALIQTHFAMGGTLININVMDKTVLLDAYQHPEKYPDLIVRVTGFTAYFIALSPEFRKLIVERVITDEPASQTRCTCAI